MRIPTESYSAIFEDYTNALAWMVEIGVVFTSGRTNHYKRVLEHWKDHYKVATTVEQQEIFPDFANSLNEVHDFISIFKAFRQIPKNDLTHITAKLQKAINGPINSVSETPKSTTARNFLFEAAFAARAHRAEKDIHAILDAASDTGIKIGKSKFWVECKRVTSRNKIESNVKKACEQLEAILSKRIGSNHRGIVALDVTKLFTKGDTIHVCKSDSELYQSIDKQMDQFIAECSHIWQNVLLRRNKKIVGVLVRFAFMSSSESRSLLVNTSQWGLNPSHNNSRNDDDMLKKLVSNLRDKDSINSN